MIRNRMITAAALATIVALLVMAPRAGAAADEFFQAATLTNANGAVGDYVGGSVAVSADGSTMVVGVPGASSNEGLAYVYTRGANGWQTANQPAVLAASGGAAGDQFGHSVAVSQDGSVVAVGAYFAAAGGTERGTIYVFNRPVGGWAAQTTLNQTTSASGPADYDRLGSSVAVSPDGTYVASGASGYSSSGPLTGQGGVYVWSYGGGALTTVGTEPLTAGDAGNEDTLGWSVAMPSDGLIYAGAPYHPGNDGPGAVYGFSSESSIEVGYSPWVHVSQTELSAAGSSLFGSSVSTGGGVVSAGAPGTSSNEGAVYLFEPAFGCATQLVHGCFRSGSNTTPTATLTDPSGNGQLGVGVALTGDGQALLVGAPGEPVPPQAPPGDAYVFQAPSGGWANTAAPNATLRPADSTSNDGFGTSVALSLDGGAVAIGGPGDDASTGGEADVFEGRSVTSPTCQPGSVGVGQPTTCTSTVTDDGIGEATPTGRVSLTSDSSGSFGSGASCTLSQSTAGTSSCQVTYTPSAANSGSHLLTASYSGDDEHASGIGQTQVAINRVTTSTTLSCSPAPVAVGESAACTAAVTASDASAGPPTGSVSLTTNGPGAFSATTCSLPPGSGATATCTFSYTPSAVGPGAHQLTAGYGGDGGHAASQGSDLLGVGEASTSTSVSCSPLTVPVGRTTTCSITVTDAGAGGLSPTGPVTFKSTGAGAFGACTLTARGGDGAACQVTYKPANAATRSPQLTATYDGDGEHFASSSSALLHVPTTGTPAVSLSSARLSHGHIRISLGCPRSEAYCRVTVTVTTPAGTLATGSIRIAGGGRATLALVPKQATLQRLRAGRYPITVNVLAVDQSGHRKRIRFSGYCVTGAHFKLVTLHVR